MQETAVLLEKLHDVQAALTEIGQPPWPGSQAHERYVKLQRQGAALEEQLRQPTPRRPV